MLAQLSSSRNEMNTHSLLWRISNSDFCHRGDLCAAIEFPDFCEILDDCHPSAYAPIVYARPAVSGVSSRGLLWLDQRNAVSVNISTNYYRGELDFVVNKRLAERTRWEEPHKPFEAALRSPSQTFLTFMRIYLTFYVCSCCCALLSTKAHQKSSWNGGLAELGRFTG
jgi:hypothetical protein